MYTPLYRRRRRNGRTLFAEPSTIASDTVAREATRRVRHRAVDTVAVVLASRRRQTRSVLHVLARIQHCQVTRQQSYTMPIRLPSIHTVLSRCSDSICNPPQKTTQSLKTEPRIKREIGYVLCKVHMCWVETASRKIQTYQNIAKNLCATYFLCLFDLDGECKFVKTKHYSK